MYGLCICSPVEVTPVTSSFHLKIGFHAERREMVMGMHSIVFLLDVSTSNASH